jgi:hypothetical protein
VGRGGGRVLVHVRAGRRLQLELHRQVLVGGEPDVVRPDPLHLAHLHQDDRREGDGDGDLRDDHRRPHAAELQAAAAGRAGPQARPDAARDLEPGSTPAIAAPRSVSAQA